jgi:hypothetical protein
MRASIAYLTSTSATGAPSPAGGGHQLDVLGYHRGERAAYLCEDVGAALPILHVLRTRGEHAGRMVALRGWYEGEDRAAVAARLRDRLSHLIGELSPMQAIAADAWALTTRVVQRRALRLPAGGRPIRKFALQLAVEPVPAGEEPVRGRATVTAYLRPRAQLDGVWAVPGEALAIARVAYVGVPEGIGLDKQVAMLVGRALH